MKRIEKSSKIDVVSTKYVNSLIISLEFPEEKKVISFKFHFSERLKSSFKQCRYFPQMSDT